MRSGIADHLAAQRNPPFTVGAHDDFTGVEILDRIMVGVVPEITAHRGEIRFFQGGAHFVHLGDIAADRSDARLDEHHGLIRLGCEVGRHGVVFFLITGHEFLVGGIRQIRRPLVGLQGADHVQAGLLENRQVGEIDGKHVIERRRFVETGLVILGEELRSPSARIEYDNGAGLGGLRGALLIQSSGVGNIINALALPAACRMPLLVIVSMRGEWGEGNPWQVPMGLGTPKALEAMGVTLFRADRADAVTETLDAAAGTAFNTNCLVAVLLSQRLIGAKEF